MEYGTQIKSVADVKGDSIAKSIRSKVAITTSYHKCYHKWALLLPTKLHLSAWVYTLYIYMYTDHLIPENFGSEGDAILDRGTHTLSCSGCNHI